ncbi:MAG TPA: Na+/H+ antiporter subunit E [Candidatus Eisenbacteria bacterium]|uniref:Na+/H+ antiporter subunit E n=1 Tax=Eiseniibacteriota bacterium TaxID=2212470 RepID=A0A7V2AVT6_UNCEI|nr:Na+/H+ antiporter subunit E [Candidatus Eisenbacteria bacterium]
MPAREHETVHPARTAAYLFAILFLGWLMLTSSFDRQELAAGVLISGALSLALQKRYRELGLPPIGIKRIAWSFAYIAVLFKEIVVANIDVAYRVIHPKMPIKPGIVVIRTELKQDIAKMILANSITLTPGTFTLDILDDRILIHWINVRTVDTEEATRMIGERFERYLRVIFA